MELNMRFQDLHSNDAGYWVAIQKIEKDICLLFHQLADYSYIMGDLYYGDVYDKPYWKFLTDGLERVKEEDRLFIIEGCLIIVMAMCSEILDGTGIYISKYLEECEQCVVGIPTEIQNERISKLREIALDAIKKCKSGTGRSEKLGKDMNWAHKIVVRGYFESKAKEFISNPYYNL